MHDLLLSVGFGLVTASVIALATVALSLQYSVTDIPNFAHGELMTVGAYSAYVVQSYTDNLIVAGAVAAAAGAVVALVLNSVVLQPYARSGAKRLVLFIVTIAFGLIVQNVLLLVFGGSSRAYALPSSPAEQIGPFLLTQRNLAVIAVGVFAMVGLHAVLTFTQFGKAQRAVADDPTLARVTGINVNRVVQVTWFISGAMTGVAGFILGATVGSLTPTLGYTFLLVVFAAAIVGGMGKPYGAMAGALLIGMGMEVSALYLPADYKEVAAFVILILVLLVRPQGLLGAARETVL
ncbi:MAG: branched-chain amino acid ABC transporter permease [Candidatus Limnocylindrales bacterium]